MKNTMVTVDELKNQGVNGKAAQLIVELLERVRALEIAAEDNAIWRTEHQLIPLYDTAKEVQEN